MVKSYVRYEQSLSFGVISSQSNVLWIAGGNTSSGRAIVGGLEEVLVWDIKTGELLQSLRDGLAPGAHNASTSEAPASVTRLAYHEVNNILAAGYHDGSIKIWDMASASVLINFLGHKSAISALEFDRSGTRLCSGSSDASIILWDLIAEEGLFKLKGHKGLITGLSFLSMEWQSKDIDEIEDYLVTVLKDGLIKLWELKTKQCIETHVAHSSECWSLGINPSQTLAITSGNKDQVKVWQIDLTKPDTEKISEIGLFEKQSKAKCSEISFTTVQNTDLVYLQNSDRTNEIYRLRSEDEIKKGIAKRTKRLKEKGYEEDEILESLRESQVSMIITNFTTLRTTSKIRGCTWAKTSSKAIDLVVSLQLNAIEYYSISIPESLRKADSTNMTTTKQHSIDLLGHRTDIRAMDLNGKLLATASNGELKIWNVKSRNVLRTFSTGGYALSCKFLPGGTLVVVGFKNGDLELYDLSSSSLMDRIEKAHGSEDGDENASSIWSLDITSDGKTLVTGGNDKKVKFWNFSVEQEPVPGTSNTILKMKLVHNQTLELDEEVLSVRVSPDNKYLAISLLNSNVQVIFLDSLKLFLTLYGHKLPVLSIDISDDNKLIITSSADKNIKIWGLDFGDCHKSIFAHQDLIMNVKFIPGSHNFFSSGKDGLLKYWDGDKFECVQKLPAHKLEVWCVCVSDDGSFVVLTSHDHSIRLWEETDDQVFLEEEKEKEMDEQYESTLLDQLEGEENNGNVDGEDDDDDMEEATRVTRQTMETLKAGEKLMEAIDIGYLDLMEAEDYAKHLTEFQQKRTTVPPVKPNKNTILMAFNMSGDEYVMSVLSKIRAAQLEDALLVFPFSYTLKFFKFIEIWTNDQHINNNVMNLSLICKVLFFIVRSNAKELSHQKDPAIKNQLSVVKTQIREALQKINNGLGFNIAGLRYVKQQWKLTHETAFIDEEEQKKYDEANATKRVFNTV